MDAEAALDEAARAGIPNVLAAQLVLRTEPRNYAAAIQAAGEIVALCRLAGMPAQAERLIGRPVVAARLELNALMVAETDRTFIDKVPQPKVLCNVER